MFSSTSQHVSRPAMPVLSLTFQVLGGGSKRRLRNSLRKAESYEEWRTAAKEMDRYLGFEEWKETEEDSLYDYALVRKVCSHRQTMCIDISRSSELLLDFERPTMFGA